MEYIRHYTQCLQRKDNTGIIHWFKVQKITNQLLTNKIKRGSDWLEKPVMANLPSTPILWIANILMPLSLVWVTRISAIVIVFVPLLISIWKQNHQKGKHGTQQDMEWNSIMLASIVLDCRHALRMTHRYSARFFWCSFGQQRYPISSWTLVLDLGKKTLVQITLFKVIYNPSSLAKG